MHLTSTALIILIAAATLVQVEAYAFDSNPLLALTAPSSACVAGAAGRSKDLGGVYGAKKEHRR